MAVCATPSAQVTVPPLVDAVKRGDHAATRTLLRNKTLVNQPETDGTTALHHAVQADDTQLVSMLIAAGANVRAANRYGLRPLTLAATNGSEPVIAQLLKYFIALGAGFMLAATCLRMIPESLSLSPHAPLLILVGYFLVHFFEHTVAPHFHFGEEDHGEVMMNPAVGYSALVGLSIHTFFDGVSIASGFLVSVPLGFLIFCAVVLHKLPEGVTVASIALASGRGSKGALSATFVLAIATLAGVVGTHTFASAVPYALPISTGVTLYVAASDLIPEVNEERGLGMTAFLFLGLALFYLTELALTRLGV